MLRANSAVGRLGPSSLLDQKKQKNPLKIRTLDLEREREVGNKPPPPSATTTLSAAPPPLVTTIKTGDEVAAEDGEVALKVTTINNSDHHQLKCCPSTTTIKTGHEVVAEGGGVSLKVVVVEF